MLIVIICKQNIITGNITNKSKTTSGLKIMISKIKYLLEYFYGYRITILISFFLLSGVTVFELLPPIFVKYFIDSFTSGNLNSNYLVISSVFMLMIILIAFVFYYSNLITFYISANVGNRIKMDLLRKFHKCDQEASDKYDAGYMVSRIESDANSVTQLLVNTIFSSYSSIFMFIFTFFYLLWSNWLLTLVILFCFPISLVASCFYSKKMEKSTLVSTEKSAIAHSSLTETMQMMTISKIFNSSDTNCKRYEQNLTESYKSSMESNKANYQYRSFNVLYFGLIPAIVLFLGGYLVVTKKMTLGEMVLFVNYSSMVLMHAQSLLGIKSALISGFICLDRIKEIKDLKEESSNADKITGEINKIDIVDLSYSYINTSDKIILDNINIVIEKPTKLGIIGSSGSGKTTLVKLLLGLYHSTKGTVLINGDDLKNIDIKSYRDKIAYVGQDPLLFNDTIKNNILFGLNHQFDDSVIAKQLEELINVCGLYFINSLPGKLDYNVGERGGRLSIGQKQRIAIARALIRKPEILILDEATSNLDSESESIIIDAVNNINNTITFIVAHKLNIINICDKVIVLENGNIVEQGTIEELNKNNGIYKKYCELYFNNQNGAEK